MDNLVANVVGIASSAGARYHHASTVDPGEFYEIEPEESQVELAAASTRQAAIRIIEAALKRLIKPFLFLAAVKAVITVLGIVLKGRFLSQQLSEGEFNAVGVRAGAEEKVTSTDFRGGYPGL